MTMVYSEQQSFRTDFKHAEATVFLRLYDRAFSFQNNPKDLDPSCKMDLDLWDCLERVKLVL